jgi:hypothetical protein
VVFDALGRFLTFFWLGHKNTKNRKNRQKTGFLIKVVKNGRFLVKNAFLAKNPVFGGLPPPKIDNFDNFQFYHGTAAVKFRFFAKT